MPDYYIGLDVGTTATKACAFSPEGNFLQATERAYDLLHPEPGAAVQKPREVVSAAEEALAELISTLEGKPLGVGLSCPMHSLILCDESGEPLTDVITWADTRAQSVLQGIAIKDRSDLHRATGTPVHPMSPLVKLRWLLQQSPRLREEATYCYDLKSYLTQEWTGTAALDEQLASASGLYSASSGGWHAPALTAAAGGEFPFNLPPVFPANHQLSWTDKTARRLGLSGVPLFLGGSDGVLANLGSNILTPGEFALSVGTSAAVRATHHSPSVDPAYGLFNYIMATDRYVIGGATNNGAKVLTYWQNLLSGHYPDVAAFIDAAMAADQSEAPSFAPWLFGERAPLWDATATAALSRLRGHHGPAHIAAAVLHGMTDNIVAIIRQLEAVTGPPERIQVTGGINKSPEWLGLLARKTGYEVVETAQPRATAYGAALVAMGRL